MQRKKTKNEYNNPFPLRPILTASAWHKGFSNDITSDPQSNRALAYELKDAASVTNDVRKIPSQVCCR